MQADYHALERYTWTIGDKSYILTRYSSSIFSLNSLACLLSRVFRQTTLHICGSRILNYKWSRGSSEYQLYYQIILFLTSTKNGSQKTNRVWRIFNSITTKNFTKIFSTVNNWVRGTIRKRIVWVWKLSLNWGQLVNFYCQWISLHTRTYKLTVRKAQS